MATEQHVDFGTPDSVQGAAAHQRSWRGPLIEELPLRSELFSADQMERYGKTLAAAHRLTPGRAHPGSAPARLAANESGADRRLQTADGRRLGESPDQSRWRMAARQLPSDRGADRAPPSGICRAATAASCRAWRSDPSAGLPRVYDIALETISHGDGRVDADGLPRFVAAYQTGHDAEAGRALGDPDHAAARADREPPPRRRPHRRR